MFDFKITKPTWIQIRYSANPQDIESILLESDQAYFKKVESYLTFHTRPDEHPELSREFQQHLLENPHRKLLVKYVVDQINRNQNPIVITFDPGRDITHELKEFWSKK